MFWVGLPAELEQIMRGQPLDFVQRAPGKAVV